MNGLLLSWYVTPANMSDIEGAKRVMAGIRFRMPRLKKIWGDAGYEGQKLYDELAVDGYEVEVIKRPHRKFQIMRRRWVVERTFGWLDQNRRMSKD